VSTDRDARSVFEAFLRAANGRDVTALEGLFDDDFEDVFPQSGELTRGLANFRSIIEQYPGGGYVGQGTERLVGTEDRWALTPSFTVVRIEGTGDTFTGVTRSRYPDGTDWYIVTIAQMRNGKLWRAETYFAQTFEPPAWRAAWVEPART
jgi:ketosteroid isomerase-like protein